jgi:hypothetical protein
VVQKGKPSVFSRTDLKLLRGDKDVIGRKSPQRRPPPIGSGRRSLRSAATKTPQVSSITNPPLAPEGRVIQKKEPEESSDEDASGEE